MVEATIVPLDPTAASLATLPGPLEGIGAANGDIVGLESIFMAEVSLWKDGNRLQLAPGTKAELGGGPLMSAGSGDIFVAKFDAMGQHVFGLRFGDAMDQAGKGIAVDSTGHILVTGDFDGSVSFGGPALQGMGSYDIFLAKLTP